MTAASESASMNSFRPLVGMKLPSKKSLSPSTSMKFGETDITNSGRSRCLSEVTVIKTVAGDGGNARAEVGRLATSTLLGRPGSVAVDASGNLYIADSSNSRILMVTKSTGIVTAVAGNGTFDYSGDGGVATAAQLGNPTDVAVDASGNLYFADTYSNRIRMVTKSTGIINTVAGNGSSGSYSGDGGLATSAAVRYPRDVAVDASGNIYIADTDNHRIRLVTKSTGIITTVAGTKTAGHSGDGGLATSATMRYPTGITVDASGNIYFADSNNNCIRMVTKSTGIITTVAGVRTSAIYEYFSGDGGPATLATLYYPRDVAVDASGNIYISDSGNNRIRMVTKSTGIITTVAGTGTAGYKGDGGLATSAKLYSPDGITVDASGNIYFADSANNRIRMVTKSTGVISVAAGDGTVGYAGNAVQASSARLYSPRGVTSDASGNIYIADGYSNTIRMMEKTTGIITIVAGNTSFYGVNGDGGYGGDGGPATLATLYYPRDVAVDASGNIYIADSYNNRIRMVTKSTRIITTVAGTGSSGYSGDGSLATSCKLSAPRSVALDASGNIYITELAKSRILMVTKSTGIITTVAGNGTRGFSGDGGLATSATLINPTGMTFDASGNLYFAVRNRVRMVTKSTGIITTVAGTGTAGYSGDGGLATSARINWALSVAVDALGNLYIADTYNNRIRMVTKSTGIITTVAGTGTAGYSGDGGQATLGMMDHPFGITIDTAGTIYISDTFNDRLRVLTLGVASAAPPTPGPSPSVSPTLSNPTLALSTSASSGEAPVENILAVNTATYYATLV
jgi:trimeric autotransporter adhesin